VLCLNLIKDIFLVPQYSFYVNRPSGKTGLAEWSSKKKFSPQRVLSQIEKEMSLNGGILSAGEISPSRPGDKSLAELYFIVISIS
jgi:hypothetical protein